MLVLASGYVLLCVGLAKLYVSPFRTSIPKLKNFSRVVLKDGEPIWISPGLQSGRSHARTLYVMSHGLGGGIGHWSLLGDQLVQKGYDVILTEMPAHGDSPDSVCTFGNKESDIIVEATKWADARYKKRPRVLYSLAFL